MARAGNMTERVLAALADVDHDAAGALDRRDGERLQLFVRGDPRLDATGELAEDLLVADVPGLANELGPVLACIENDDDRGVGRHHPAQPARELRPQGDGDRAGRMAT